jgi:hypothetical protein
MTNKKTCQYTEKGQYNNYCIITSMLRDENEFKNCKIYGRFNREEEVK